MPAGPGPSPARSARTSSCGTSSRLTWRCGGARNRSVTLFADGSPTGRRCTWSTRAVFSRHRPTSFGSQHPARQPSSVPSVPGRRAGCRVGKSIGGTLGRLRGVGGAGCRRPAPCSRLGGSRGQGLVGPRDAALGTSGAKVDACGSLLPEGGAPSRWGSSTSRPSTGSPCGPRIRSSRPSPPSGGGPVAPQPWPWSSSSSSPPDSGGGRAVNAPHLVPLLSSTFRATLRAISPSPTTCPGGAVCWSVRVIVGQYGGVSLAISG